MKSIILTIAIVSTTAGTLGAAPSTGCKTPWTKAHVFRSVKGRPIDVLTLGTGASTVLIIGGVHGDEPQGVRLVRDLQEHLSALSGSRLHNRVVIIPVANPDGLAQRTRWNANRVDINRNLPTRDFKVRTKGRYYGGARPLSEPETRAIVSVLKEYHPSLVISIHAPLGKVLYSNQAKNIAKLISSLDGLPIRKGVAYPTPGALGTYCGTELGIPIITLELLPSDNQWNRHGKALLTAVGAASEKGKAK